VANPRTFSGARLCAIRRALGLKAEQVAVAIDRSAFTIYAYERGACVPSAAALGELSAALNCRIDDFYTESVDAAA